MSEDNKNQERKKYLLLAAAALLLVGAFIFGRMIEIPSSYDHSAKAEVSKEEASDIRTSRTKSLPSIGIDIFEDDLLIGDIDNPKVTVIEYASMTCPHCADFHNKILKELKNKYGNNSGVLFIYRDFPLDRFALMASQIARCDKEKREAFTNIIFKKQHSWIKGKPEDIIDNLYLIGKLGGLSKDKIQSCIDDEKLAEKIILSRKYGTDNFKVDSTPFIIINGDNVKNGKGFKYYQNKIDSYL